MTAKARSKIRPAGRLELQSSIPVEVIEFAMENIEFQDTVRRPPVVNWDDLSKQVHRNDVVFDRFRRSSKNKSQNITEAYQVLSGLGLVVRARATVHIRIMNQLLLSCYSVVTQLLLHDMKHTLASKSPNTRASGDNCTTSEGNDHMTEVAATNV